MYSNVKSCKCRGKKFSNVGAQLDRTGFPLPWASTWSLAKDFCLFADTWPASRSSSTNWLGIRKHTRGSLLRVFWNWKKSPASSQISQTSKSSVWMESLKSCGERVQSTSSFSLFSRKWRGWVTSRLAVRGILMLNCSKFSCKIQRKQSGWPIWSWMLPTTTIRRKKIIIQRQSSTSSSITTQHLTFYSPSLCLRPSWRGSNRIGGFHFNQNVWDPFSNRARKLWRRSTCPHTCKDVINVLTFVTAFGFQLLHKWRITASKYCHPVWPDG